MEIAEEASCEAMAQTPSPDGRNFPKPDFTVVTDSPIFKPTFKSTLQAKKRLQAFSSSRVLPLPSSPIPKKTKPVPVPEEKVEDAPLSIKKHKKGSYHEEIAKSVIEEIEELKRDAMIRLTAHLRKSRSRSTDREKFRRVSKKSRNYRRRSETPEKTKKMYKKTRKYPRNWADFMENQNTFDVNKEMQVNPAKGNNDILRQMLFESPSQVIGIFTAKNENREEKIIPFQCLRYTRAKPSVAYSINDSRIKQNLFSKTMIMPWLPKENIDKIEHLHNDSLKFKIDLEAKTSQSWFPKNWKNTETHCHLLENSSGLSFLQSYTADEEEIEVEVPKIELLELTLPILPEESKKELDPEIKSKAVRSKSSDSEKLPKKKKKNKKSNSKKKKKVGEENEKPDKKKKKKRKKDSKKVKEKRSNGKEDDKKSVPKEDPLKPNKQQVVEELKKIEEQLAKKREIKTNEKMIQNTRKRKTSEHEESAKKAKFETVDEQHPPIEHIPEKKAEICNFVNDFKLKTKDKAKKDERGATNSRKSEEFVKHPDKYHNPIRVDEKKSERKSEERPKRIEDRIKSEERGRKGEDNSTKRCDGYIKKHEDIFRKSEERVKKRLEDAKSEEEPKKPEKRPKSLDPKEEKTPDTDEYHSHWESDDDLPPATKRTVKKPNRSWESDEELFDRTYHGGTTEPHNYSNLEIPLNIANFPRRSKWDHELKQLEEQRKSLSEERKRLELARQEILKMQKEVKKVEHKNIDKPVVSEVKREEIEFTMDSLNGSILSNVSSVESNYPLGVLENEYEEFIKAVSSDTSQSASKKRTNSFSSDSSSSTSSSSDSDHKKKRRRKKKKKKKKINNIFNEFDIPVPSDLPEMVPLPVPSPSPIDTVFMGSLLPPITTEPKPTDLELMQKPFVFPTITLPIKKLIDNSGLKLDDDSDSEDFASKLLPEEKKEETEPVAKKAEEVTQYVEFETKQTEPSKSLIEPPKQIPVKPEEKPAKSTEESKHSSSSMASPVKSDRKERKRSRSRSRDRDPRRRSSPKKPDPSPQSRRRRSPPRRRTPLRRRGSPRRRSPSPRRRSLSPWRRSLSPNRRSPMRRRRRSRSISPPRRLGSARKRSSSPRIRRASPLHSPLDGFKRSVADSTISDDMLPQAMSEDYVESPPIYARRQGKTTSPNSSPKRISLDDRINQVLGLEKNEHMMKPMDVWATPPVTYANPYANQYSHYPQYGQYTQKGDFGSVAPGFGASPFMHPPPPIPKSASTATKVVQVGNILQVVPTEEIPQTCETKVLETPQKIVQVGNMLQIVPGVMPPTMQTSSDLAMVQSTPEKIADKQSAEDVMAQKNAERKSEREKRRQEREWRRKEKEKKRKEKDKRKQIKLKLKTENMIKKALQLETDSPSVDDVDDPVEEEAPILWTPSTGTVSLLAPPGKGILANSSGSKPKKSVQFADGVRPGEGTSPSGGEELSSPPPILPSLPKEKRYKKHKKVQKRKIKVKVVKKSRSKEDDEDYENLPPPSPPPGSPPPHLFPPRIKVHAINTAVLPFVGAAPTGYPFVPPPMSMVINRPPPGFLPPSYHTVADVNSMPHPAYQGVPSHH